MMTLIMIFAGIQFVAGMGFLWINTYDYNTWRNRYNNYLDYLNKSKSDRYYSRPEFDDEKCLKNMKFYSKWSRASAIALLTSPFAIVVVPVFIIGSVVLGGYRITSNYIVPAIANKHELV